MWARISQWTEPLSFVSLCFSKLIFVHNAYPFGNKLLSDIKICNTDYYYEKSVNCRYIPGIPAEVVSWWNNLSRMVIRKNTLRKKGERRYSSYSFSTSALDRGEWSASRPGRALAPGERTPGAHCTGGWVGPRAGLDTEVKNSLRLPHNIINFVRGKIWWHVQTPTHKDTYIYLLQACFINTDRPL
jgi:hypothetical protein